MAHGGQAMMALDRAGKVTFATRGAESLVDRHFLGSGIRASALPGGFREWVSQEASRRAVRLSSPTRAAEYVVESEGRRLVARFIPSGRESEQDLVLLTETTGTGATDLAALGLSKREAEVLRLVARGKTDAEIAAALVVSPRTVQKHLEHVYEKLGVRTRTAAVSRAFGQVGVPLGEIRRPAA